MPTTNLAHERFIAAMKEGKDRIRAYQAAYPGYRGWQYVNKLKQIGGKTQASRHFYSYSNATLLYENACFDNLKRLQNNPVVTVAFIKTHPKTTTSDNIFHPATTPQWRDRQTSFSAETSASITIPPKMPQDAEGVLKVMLEKTNKNKQHI